MDDGPCCACRRVEGTTEDGGMVWFNEREVHTSRDVWRCVDCGCRFSRESSTLTAQLAEAERTIAELNEKLESEMTAFRVAHGMNGVYKRERDEARRVAVWVAESRAFFEKAGVISPEPLLLVPTQEVADDFPYETFDYDGTDEGRYAALRRVMGRASDD